MRCAKNRPFGTRSLDTASVLVIQLHNTALYLRLLDSLWCFFCIVASWAFYLSSNNQCSPKDSRNIYSPSIGLPNTAT